MLRCVKCCSSKHTSMLWVPVRIRCFRHHPHRTVWGLPRDIHVKSRVERHTTTRMILMPWTHSLRFSLRSRSSLSRTRWQVWYVSDPHIPTPHIPTPHTPTPHTSTLRYSQSENERNVWSYFSLHPLGFFVFPSLSKPWTEETIRCARIL